MTALFLISNSSKQRTSHTEPRPAFYDWSFSEQSYGWWRLGECFAFDLPKRSTRSWIKGKTTGGRFLHKYEIYLLNSVTLAHHIVLMATTIVVINFFKFCPLTEFSGENCQYSWKWRKDWWSIWQYKMWRSHPWYRKDWGELWRRWHYIHPTFSVSAATVAVSLVLK